MTWPEDDVRLTLLAIVVLCGVVLGGVGVAHSSQPVDPRDDPALDRHGKLASNDGREASAVDAESSGSSIPATLEGSVTAEPVRTDEGILVGTDRGLYVLNNGTIEQFVATQPVRRVLHVDGDTAVVLLKDDHFSNVKAVDLANGAVRWSQSHERTVYDPQFGTIDRQVPAFDAAAMGDRDGDGTTDVAVSAGSTVFGVSGASGERLWNVTRENTIWRVAAIDGRVYAGTAGGAVTAIETDSGTVAFDRQLTTPFSSESVDSVARSVWSVEPVTVGGDRRLAATTESGTVALLAPEDGSIVWEKDIVGFDPKTLTEYYNRGSREFGSVPGDSLYFNLDLTVVEPADDEASLAVSVSVTKRSPRGRRYPLPRDELYVLSAESGSVRWSKSNAGLSEAGNLAYSPDIGDGSLLVPSRSGETTRTMATYGLSSGSEATVKIPAVSGLNRGGGQSFAYAITLEDELATVSTDGDLTAFTPGGDITWNLPSLRSGSVISRDFTGDGTIDHLVASRNSRHGTVRHRTLVLRSGTDGSVVWSRSQPLADLYTRGGLTKLTPVDTGDGVDLVAIRRQPREQATDGNRPLSRMVYLSGDNGSIVASHDLVNDEEHARDRPGQRFHARSVDVFGDLSGDGVPEVLIGTNMRVFALELASGNVTWERLYRSDPGDGAQTWQPVDSNGIIYRAVGGDGDLQSFIAVSKRSGEIALVRPEDSGGSVSFSTVATGNVSALNSDEIQTIDDRNGDGYDEVVVRIREQDRSYQALYSPGDGTVVGKFGQREGASVEAVAGNFIGNDRPGMLATHPANDGTTVGAYSGFEQQWSEDFGRYGVARSVGVSAPDPVAPAGDVDGDGTNDVAVVKSSPRSGAVLEIHSVSTDSLISKIELAPFESVGRPPVPGLHAQQIPDQTGDGVPDLAVVAATSGSSSQAAQFFIVDPKAGTVVMRGNEQPSRFFVLGDGLGLIGNDGSLATIDTATSVTLTESEGDSRIDLAWEFASGEQYVSEVTVNGRLVAQTSGQSTTVRLPSGLQTIKVSATNTDGITVVDTAFVTTDASSSAGQVLHLAAGLSVAVPFGLALLPTIRRRVR